MSTNAELFDFEKYLAGIDPDLLLSVGGRIEATKYDPLLFAVLYCQKHIQSEQTGEISFADLHLELIEQAKQWIVQSTRPRQHRDIYVAPRETGKSTWLFLILPLWAAAHGHRKFIIAFAHSATQSQDHLKNFKHELETNASLRRDFPLLCQPATRNRGTTFSDTQQDYRSKSGFAFKARGMDTQTLGVKVENKRPDLIILDDIEPDESSYSAYLKQKRLQTILDAILPLNEFARVVMSGTVTMVGSIIHDAVKSVTRKENIPWLREQNFKVHYFPPLISRGDGTERSIWPKKWTVKYLLSIRHTREYKKNFANDPMGSGGGFWLEEVFRYEELDGPLRTGLFIDPATKTKTSSDFTGLGVCSFNPTKKRMMVEHAEEVKLVGEKLRARVLKLLEIFPHIGRIFVEDNQGGEHWHSILHHMPVKVVLFTSTVKKEVRAGRAHTQYERGRIVHQKKLPALEEQMVGFPRAPHDDMVDTVSAAVETFFNPVKKKKLEVSSASYV